MWGSIEVELPWAVISRGVSSSLCGLLARTFSLFFFLSLPFVLHNVGMIS